MEALCTIIVGAILVEAVVSAVKPIWDEEKRRLSWSMVASVVSGVGISFAAGLDIAGALGVGIAVPVVPELITGVIISRGSNYVYDLVERIKAGIEQHSI